MANYDIVNPAAGNVYFDTSASARDADATTLGSGAAVGLGNTQTNMSRVQHGVNQNALAGSTVVSGVGGANAASSAGTFAKQEASNFVVQHASFNVAGVANTSLRGSAGQFARPRRGIHKLESSLRHDGAALAIRNGYWNAFSGTFSPAATATNNSVADVSGSTITDGSADQAATPTRATPGEFAYRHHSPTVQQADYSSKNS